MGLQNYTTAEKSIIGTRNEQQDCAFHKVEDDKLIAVVCDGMGGMENGKAASTAAVEKFKELYEKKNPAEAMPSFYLNSVDILDECVFHLKDKDGRLTKAGTTFVAAAVEEDNLYWLSIGDSRLYILRGNELVQITRDHNYHLRLNQMKQNKEIDEDKYKAEVKKGDALISFVGMGGIEIMDINKVPFKLLPNDTLLLATDGLYKLMADDEIKDCLLMENVDEALEMLMNRATQNMDKFQDNTTCIIIRYSKGA